MLDDLLSAATGGQSFGCRSQAPSGGGLGGLGSLGGLLNQLERSGHAEHAQSWVGTGQNMPISPDAIGQLFGQDSLEEIARRAGLSTHEASAGLAHLLPSVIDHVTPGGQVPDGDQLAGTLQDLMRRLGG